MGGEGMREKGSVWVSWWMNEEGGCIKSESMLGGKSTIIGISLPEMKPNNNNTTTPHQSSRVQPEKRGVDVSFLSIEVILICLKLA